MPFTFYRKESIVKMNNHFRVAELEKNKDIKNALVNEIVIEAKPDKVLSFLLKEQGINHTITAQAIGATLQIADTNTSSQKTIYMTYTETSMEAILKRRDTDSLEYKILDKICLNHAAGSRKSPLISGCTLEQKIKTNNEGHMLKIELRTRKAFENPYGIYENEWFLIGKVEEHECEAIMYLGKKNRDL